MNNQRRTTIFTLRYYAIGCVFVFSDGVLITMRSPEHPRARRYTPEQTDNTDPTIGHKNTRQVTPWGVLPGGRNLPRFFLWIGTDNHRRTPYGIADGWEIVEMRGNAVFVKDRCSVVLMEQVIYNQTKIKDSYITFTYTARCGSSFKTATTSR